MTLRELFNKIFYLDISFGDEFSKSLPGIEQHFDVKANVSAQFPNEPINDSCSFKQDFYNYYSYDDGSAEAAFGPTGTQSRLAISFDSYEADSLIGIMMHFVPSVTDVSNKLFLTSVWGDNNGEPGELLYEDDVFLPRNPIYTDGINGFYTYFFKDMMKVPVGVRFHVGWRQLDGDRLNLGLDRNIDHSETIRFSVDGGNTWQSSPYSGSAMIRPVFSTGLDQTLGIINDKKESVSIYPNPTSEYITISSSKNLIPSTIELYDTYGQMILKTEDNSIDLSDYQNGLYFIRVPLLSSETFKVIKQ